MMVSPFNTVLACLLIGCVTAAQLDSFYTHEVVPDIIPFAPEAALYVEWTKTGARVDEGNVLLNSQMQNSPDMVQWESDPGKHYSLLMTDADAPGRTDRTRSEVRHWALVNIPGGDLYRGLTLASYAQPRGTQGMGLHRYIFLVYDQPQGYIDPELFDDSWITDPDESRTGWSLFQFAEKYKLGGPIAGNFFQSEWLD